MEGKAGLTEQYSRSRWWIITIKATEFSLGCGGSRGQTKQQSHAQSGLNS